MTKIILTLTAVLMLTAACANQRTTLDANPAFASHQYASHDLLIKWKSENIATGIRIAGTVTNVRSDLPYTSLELTAKLLDEKGNVLAKEKQDFPGRFIGSEAFTIEIPLEKRFSVRRIGFTYSYGTEEDHYSSQFESEI